MPTQTMEPDTCFAPRKKTKETAWRYENNTYEMECYQKNKFWDNLATKTESIEEDCKNTSKPVMERYLEQMSNFGKDFRSTAGVMLLIAGTTLFTCLCILAAQPNVSDDMLQLLTQLTIVSAVVTTITIVLVLISYFARWAWKRGFRYAIIYKEFIKTHGTPKH